MPNPSLNPVTFITKFLLNPPMILHYHNSRLSFIISHPNFWNTPLLGLPAFSLQSKSNSSKHLTCWSLQPLEVLQGIYWRDQTLLTSVLFSLLSALRSFLPQDLRTPTLSGLEWSYLQAWLKCHPFLLRDNYHLPFVNLLLDPFSLLNKNNHNLLHVCWCDHLKKYLMF